MDERKRGRYGTAHHRASASQLAASPLAHRLVRGGLRCLVRGGLVAALARVSRSPDMAGNATGSRNRSTLPWYATRRREMKPLASRWSAGGAEYAECGPVGVSRLAFYTILLFRDLAFPNLTCGGRTFSCRLRRLCGSAICGCLWCRG